MFKDRSITIKSILIIVASISTLFISKDFLFIGPSENFFSYGFLSFLIYKISPLIFPLIVKLSLALSFIYLLSKNESLFIPIMVALLISPNVSETLTIPLIIFSSFGAPILSAISFFLMPFFTKLFLPAFSISFLLRWLEEKDWKSMIPALFSLLSPPFLISLFNGSFLIPFLYSINSFPLISPIKLVSSYFLFFSLSIFIILYKENENFYLKLLISFLSFIFKPFFLIPILLKKGKIALKYLFLIILPFFFILKDYEIKTPPKRVFEIVDKIDNEKVTFFLHPSIYYQIKNSIDKPNIVIKPEENLKDFIKLYKLFPHHPPLEGYETFESDIVLTVPEYPKNQTFRKIKKDFGLVYCGKDYALFMRRELAQKKGIKIFENYSPYLVIPNNDEKRRLALNEIDEILKYEPEFFEALRDKGRILIDFKEYEKAIEILKEALKIRKSGEVYNDIGVAYYNLQKYELALENFLYSVKLMPNALYPRMGLALCAYELDKLEEAKIILEDLNSKFPTFYPAFRLHSRVYGKLRDLEKAKELLRKIPKELRTVDENELLNEK